MKKKRLNLRKLWFSLFLFVGITASASPGILQVTEANDVAQIGETKYQSLQEAFNAANTGDVIILLKDYNAASESMAGGTRQFVIKKSITLNGQGYTLTTKEKGIGIGNVNKDLNDNINVTIKNITIQNTSSGARCIDTRGYVGSLTLENVTLKTDGASGTTQPLTIGGNQADPATIHITNSTIQTNDAGTAYYAIITYNPVNMTISDSTIKGWACIYAKGQDGSAGSAGSVYTIDRCELVSSNAYSGVRNAFSAFMIEDNNVSIQVTNTDITINNTGDQLQTLVGYPSSGNYTGSVTLGEGNTINFAGPNDCSLLMNSDPSNLTITGGSYNFDPTPYLSDDFKVVNVNGEWVIQEKVYVAQIGTTRYETLAEAVAEVKDNETILMIADVAQAGGRINGNGDQRIPAAQELQHRVQERNRQHRGGQPHTRRGSREEHHAHHTELCQPHARQHDHRRNEPVRWKGPRHQLQQRNKRDQGHEGHCRNREHSLRRVHMELIQGNRPRGDRQQ